MTTPTGRTPHPDDPAEGAPEDARQSSGTEPHPDSRGEHTEDPAEGSAELPH